MFSKFSISLFFAFDVLSQDFDVIAIHEGGLSFQSSVHFHSLSDQIRSDQISRSVVSDSLRSHESQHTYYTYLSVICKSFSTILDKGLSSVQSLSRVWLFVTPWTAAHLSITNSQSLLKLMSIESVMPSNHLILCHPLFLLPVVPSIRVFSNESVLPFRWPK